MAENKTAKTPTDGEPLPVATSAMTLGAMTPSEELHLQAAAYANKRKEAYLDYVKKGEKLSEEMLGWIWVAHYEGWRDAMQEKNK